LFRFEPAMICSRLLGLKRMSGSLYGFDESCVIETFALTLTAPRRSPPR